MKAVILQPTKCITQSGKALKKFLLIAIDDKDKKYKQKDYDWTGCSDPIAQIRLQFDSQEAAINFAIENGIEYELIKAHHKKPIPKSYASNFT